MKIKCLKCNDIIESLSQHDFNACSIDGGTHYTRIGGNPKYINIIYEDGTEKLLDATSSKAVDASKRF